MPGNRKFHRRYLLAIFFWALSLGCQKSSQSESSSTLFPTQVLWEGRLPTSYEMDTASERPVHHFEFLGADTLRLSLSEFPSDFSAYAAFQKKAALSDFLDGFYRDQDGFFFCQGHFLGELHYSRPELITRRFLEKNLSVQGGELFRIPEIFKSFPLLERIPQSERVIEHDFLGRQWKGPVFSVRYKCHEDTATAFRAFPQLHDTASNWIRQWTGKVDTLGWHHEMHFSGIDEFHRPLIFWFFSNGIIGFRDCFDGNLSQEYAEKIKKMTFLISKP